MNLQKLSFLGNLVPWRHVLHSSRRKILPLSCFPNSWRNKSDLHGYQVNGKILELASKMIQRKEGSPNVLDDDSLAQIKMYLKEMENGKTEIAELEQLLKDENDQNGIMHLAKNELEMMKAKLSELERKIVEAMLPSDAMDSCTIILEITAGVGGQEAMLFAADLYNMYMNFIQIKKWTIISLTVDKNTSAGGLRHASLTVSGHNVYRLMKYEGGIHRVQRVPKTEKSGRIHTSTVSVAILMQPSEIQVSLNPKDLKFEMKRASGAGGQHVNTTESAVRVTHLPTGISVENQTERSQVRNKELALQRLRWLIHEQRLEKQLASQRLKRKLQVGTSARSEKIRTYNFLQDRITDHRIGLTLHNLEEYMNGGASLITMIEKLQLSAMKEDIQELLQK